MREIRLEATLLLGYLPGFLDFDLFGRHLIFPWTHKLGFLQRGRCSNRAGHLALFAPSGGFGGADGVPGSGTESFRSFKDDMDGSDPIDSTTCLDDIGPAGWICFFRPALQKGQGLGCPLIS